jgi:hypothetical protein
LPDLAPGALANPNPAANPAASLALLNAGSNPGAPPPSSPAAPAPNAPSPGPAAPAQPQAYQPVPDLAAGNQNLSTGKQLMDLYTQMAQREMVINGLHRGIATMLAGASRNPGDRQLLMQAGENPIVPSAADQFGNLMKINQFALQQAQMQRYYQNLPAIGALMGMDPRVLSAMPPDEVGKMVASRVSLPDDIKKLQALGVPLPGLMGGASPVAGVQPSPAAGNPALDPARMIASATGASPEQAEYAGAVHQWQLANPGQPLPPNLATIAGYNADKNAQNTTATERAKDQQESSDKFAGTIGALDDMSRRISRIRSNPNLPSILGNTIAQKLINDPEPDVMDIVAQHLPAYGLTADQIALIGEIRQLKGQNYATQFTAAGSRRTQQEMSALAGATQQLGNLGLSPKAYTAQLDNMDRMNKVARGSAYGAAGRLEDLPENLRPYVNRNYVPGGGMYIGHGASWAVPTSVSSGADIDKLSQGQAYKPADGKYAGMVLYKGYEPDGLALAGMGS